MRSTLSLLVALSLVVGAQLMHHNQAMTGGNHGNNYQGTMMRPNHMSHQRTVPTGTGNHSPINSGPSAMSLYQMAMGSDKAANMALFNMMMNSPNADTLVPLMMLSNTNGGRSNNNNDFLRTMAIMNTLNRGQQGNGQGQGLDSLMMMMALSGNQEGKSMFPMLSGTPNNGASSAEGGNSQAMDMYMLSRMV
ncbi:uncharacterized protein [Haliotis cracherodii]|uniref:uncharacterized protein n=1 Tax=Haliotis cracherodii TaxID=6455 RepID=UPI0039EB429A